MYVLDCFPDVCCSHAPVCRVWPWEGAHSISQLKLAIPVGPIQAHRSYSSGHLYFFSQLIKHFLPQKALCPSLHLALSSSSLPLLPTSKKNPLCSLSDTIPLAPNHCSGAEKSISSSVCAAAGRFHPYSTCRRTIRESLSRCGACDCLLLPVGRADSALKILVRYQERLDLPNGLAKGIKAGCDCKPEMKQLRAIKAR